MQLDFSSVKGFFWAFARMFYSLIPASFFLFMSIVFCIHFHDSYPKQLQNIINYFVSNDNNVKISFFILTAFVLTFITNTFEFIRWNDDNNTKPETALKNYTLKLDDQISSEKIGIPNLTGVKIIQEYENVNTYTFTIMAHKDVLLGIYNYINCTLILFLPFYLHIEFQTSNSFFLFLLIAQLVFFLSQFLLMKMNIGKLTASKNWGDKTISKSKHLIRLAIFPIVGLSLFFIPLSSLNSNWFSSSAVLIAINFILIPIEFLMVLAAYNYHNRVRNLVDSAFIQIRYNDIIFRESKNEERKHTNENSN